MKPNRFLKNSKVDKPLDRLTKEKKRLSGTYSGVELGTLLLIL